MIQFDLPKDQSSILKVVGIGGGGGNAVNYMFEQNIEGVDFIICNTDAQALANSRIPNKIQLGPNLTQGLGAGANPEIGKEATEESIEEIKSILEVNTKMVFITAGMGGGTGTGGAPIVAQICKELDILTVGIVTTPFSYEGIKRKKQAQLGIEQLKDNVDTLLVISNDKLRHQFGNLTVRAAFSKADNVLATAAKCITDVISSTGQINVDFADVSTVMRKGGVAILGSAECSGENRAKKAIEQALNSPLLNDNDIRGARWILININSATGEHEFTMDEVDTIQTHLLSQAGEGSDVILGLGYDDNLEDKISITLIATGFEEEEVKQQKREVEKTVRKEASKEVLELKTPDKKAVSQPLFLFDQDNQPAVSDKKNEQEKTEKPAGLRKDEVIAALKEDQESAISNDLKTELVDYADDENISRPIDLFSMAASRPSVQPQKEEKTTLPDSHHAENHLQFDQPAAHPEKPTAEKPDQQPFRKTQIYVERVSAPKRSVETPKTIVPDITDEQDDDFVGEMKLVEREPAENAETGDNERMDAIESKTVIRLSNESEASTETGSLAEEDELKRRTMDRISRLRNLSYSSNAADPSDEYENVPAYMRRNLELHNSIANIESFYKNYTVEPDEESKIRINGINTYLGGEKPD